MIYQETKIVLKEDEIIFDNPQFLLGSQLFIKKRGSSTFENVPVLASEGYLKIEASYFEEMMLSTDTQGVSRYDLYAKLDPESEFEALLSGEIIESNQFEKIQSTSQFHKFIKIYTTLTQTFALAVANFNEGVVFTNFNESNNLLEIKSFSTPFTEVKWNKSSMPKNDEIQEEITQKSLPLDSEDFKFFKPQHLLYISEGNKKKKIKYGLIEANYTHKINDYESITFKSNGSQDIVKAEKSPSLDTSKIQITQEDIVNEFEPKEGLKFFIKERGSSEYQLINEISVSDNLKINHQVIFELLERNLKSSGIYDFFFSDLDELFYFPFNLATSIEPIKVFSEGSGIALKYYATKNNNLALSVEKISSIDAQARVISYSRERVDFEFVDDFKAVSLWIIKRKDKNSRYTVDGIKQSNIFSFPWSKTLDELTKEQVGAIHDLYLWITLSNGNGVVRRLANINESDTVVKVNDDKDRYLDVVELVEGSDNLHNQAIQLYLTLDNKWSINKGRAYNLRKTTYKIDTKVISYSEDDKGYTLRVLLSNQTQSNLDYSQLVLVNRNRLVHIETPLETTKLIIDDNKIILTATFSPQKEMLPFYYDLFVIVDDNENSEVPFYVQVKTVDKSVNKQINHNVFAHQRFLDEFVMYPYITNLGDIAFEHRLYETFENSDNYQKEINAERISKQLKNKLSKEKIWIIFEKNAQGGHDNGFHFFKYIMEHTDRKNVYYVIDPSSPEYKNLLPYKDNILDFMSEKYFVYLFLADLLISSDTRYHVYNTHIKSSPIGKALAKKTLIFLQHGVNGIKRVPAFHKNSKLLDFICVPDEYEKQMVINQWGYKAKEVAVTGLARWDSYSDKTAMIPYRQIFIMPTWRKWMDGMSNDQFVETQFYKEYASLLSSPLLKKIVLENNARISFFLHPYFKKYVELFDIDETFVDKYGYLDVDMGEEIQKSSLMISDYSSVLWDMFYLDKPVIFYQFDQKDYLLSEGSYMDYDTELFGDVVFNANDLISSMSEIITNNFVLQDKYQNMRSDYFTYIDQNNSERIYNVVKNIKPKKAKKAKTNKKLSLVQKSKKFLLRVIRKIKRELKKRI